MHKEQERHVKPNNNIISKLAVIVLSIVLLTGISLVPVIQAGVYAQLQRQTQQLQQTPQQQNKAGQMVDTANSTKNPLFDILIAIATGTVAAALITFLGNYMIRKRQEYTDISKHKIDIISKSGSLYIQLGSYYLSLSSIFRNLQLKNATEKLILKNTKLALIQYANNNPCLSIEECNNHIKDSSRRP